MTYGEFKDYLISFMPGRTELPDDAILRHIVHRALKRIANETTPLWLIVDSDSSATILRKIDDNTYIRTPIFPYRDDDDVDIDSELTEAVAFYVASEIEPQRKGHYLSNYEREIREDNDGLIESSLSLCENGGAAWL